MGGIGWKRKRAQPAEHLRVALGSHRFAKKGDPSRPYSCPEPLRRVRERMLRRSREFGSGYQRAGGPAPVHFSPRARGLQTLPTETCLPPLHPPSPTSAPGSGVWTSASSRAPLRMGSGRSASTNSIGGLAGSSWRRQPGSPSPRPGLGAPPPAGCMPRGQPGGGRSGARSGPRLPKRRAEWAAPPSGARCALRPASPGG